MDIAPGIDNADVSPAERLAFKRLLGDLSARFADLPADQVIEEIGRALTRMMDFLGFDRCTFAEVTGVNGPFEILCSVSRDGIEPMPPGPAPAFRWYFGQLGAGRIVVLADIPGDFPAEAKVERAPSRRI